ncbi:NADH-quinone oxidoreductase subunit L [Candidatus Eisenbacteria bacterium]|uniref:NADH-quinone oxidoreductase subunit L n=1 Tax=Eiseniibacteriota bacterium TaxID=2212470 RepID=A0ABV6YIU0_UNCEI
MPDIHTVPWVVLLTPLLAAVLITLVTLRFRRLSAGLSIGACAISFLLSLPLVIAALKHPHGAAVRSSVPWINVGDLRIEMGATVDTLTAAMLLVVTFIGLLIHIYSVGYMHGEAGFSRYFAKLSLFMFSMLGIVLADNYVMIFVFWELVGLSSYLLIGYDYHRTAAANAGKKAFVVNRIGDFGFILGIVLLFYAAGSVNFQSIEESLAGGSLAAAPLLAGALLVFMGALAKSAQFPLHVWLPDAMEGPTPVSALIHAATMVAAGVYLLARTFSLLAAAPDSMIIIAYIGGFTALFAATIAIVQSDIKRILAYSTLSQLGYMVMAIGLGSVTAGMFHLTTHAFFKALLFLGAGSVIHALHTQDIWEMGGLLKRMPVTGWTFLIGALALAGIPPLAGFFSKDEVLAAAHGSPVLYVVGVITAFLTAFYVARLLSVAFLGAPRKDIRTHESPAVMTVPLILLAVGSVLAGWVGAGCPIPFLHHSHTGFGTYVFAGGHPHAPEFHADVMILSAGVALAGLVAGYLVYSRGVLDPQAVRERFARSYQVLAHKYYMDEIYDWLVLRGQQGWARLCDGFDRWILIRSLVNGFSHVTRWTGDKTRLLQTGQLQFELLILSGGTALLLLMLLMGGK